MEPKDGDEAEERQQVLPPPAAAEQNEPHEEPAEAETEAAEDTQAAAAEKPPPPLAPAEPEPELLAAAAATASDSPLAPAAEPAAEPPAPAAPAAPAPAAKVLDSPADVTHDSSSSSSHGLTGGGAQQEQHSTSHTSVAATGAAGHHRHKETAVGRLTTPTAMRMLKQLEQTQGGRNKFHIATGVPFTSKRLSAGEMEAMTARLATPKHAEDSLPPKLHAVKLAFQGTREVLVSVKESTRDDNIAYMSSLYTRCQETRARTQQALQDKWLQPLGRPKAASTHSKQPASSGKPKVPPADVVAP